MKDHRPALYCSQLFPDAVESGVGTGSAKVVNAAIDGVVPEPIIIIDFSISQPL